MAGRRDPAALGAAVAGDGYGWLARRLADPDPVPCPGCGRPLAPRCGAIVLDCARCYPPPPSGPQDGPRG